MEEIKLHDTALYQNLRYAFRQTILANCDKILDALMPVVEPLIGQLYRDLEEYKTINVSSTTPVLIDSYLEKFKSLQHIARDTWMNDENGSIKEFSGQLPPPKGRGLP